MIRCSCGVLAMVAVAAASAAPPKKAAHPAPKSSPANTVKGQKQIVGANGEFGMVYTLKDGSNLSLLSARYTLEPFVAYTPVTAETDKKLLVIDLSIKNANPQDFYFNPDSLFTLVDQKGELYNSGSLALRSKGRETSSFNLRPGQGLGQPALNDPLEVAFSLPSSARIVKVMVNQGRKGRSEETIRYFIAGATQAEAGEKGDPKNAISPLPAEARDPADPSGAVPLETGKGMIGAYFPSGSFALRLDSFAYSTEAIMNNAGPDEGKKFAVATVTAKSLMPTTLTMFEVTGGDFPLFEITDSDGEREKPADYRKSKRDEDPEHDFKQGDEYAFRILFALPQDATAKTLVLGAGSSRKWAFDVSGVK